MAMKHGFNQKTKNKTRKPRKTRKTMVNPPKIARIFLKTPRIFSLKNPCVACLNRRFEAAALLKRYSRLELKFADL